MARPMEAQAIPSGASLVETKEGAKMNPINQYLDGVTGVDLDAKLTSRPSTSVVELPRTAQGTIRMVSTAPVGNTANCRIDDPNKHVKTLPQIVSSPKCVNINESPMSARGVSKRVEDWMTHLELRLDGPTAAVPGRHRCRPWWGSNGAMSAR